MRSQLDVLRGVRRDEGHSTEAVAARGCTETCPLSPLWRGGRRSAGRSLALENGLVPKLRMGGKPMIYLLCAVVFGLVAGYALGKLLDPLYRRAGIRFGGVHMLPLFMAVLMMMGATR